MQSQMFDRGQLAAVYDEYYPPLYRYIYRQVSDVETARDLTADLFQRFLQAVQKQNGPSQNVKAWLYRAAHNLVVDFYRRQQHRQHEALPEQVEDMTPEHNPVDLAEAHLSAEQLRTALHNLTPEQQQVISLKFLAGLSNQEAAEVMGKPIGAVKSLQHRALAALQRQLVPAEEMT